jgi:hypothetical protein
MPEPAQHPVLKPNVKIEDVKLPSNPRVRTSFEYRASAFSFTLANYEVFAVPLHWRLESIPFPLGTTINYVVYPTEGKVTVAGNAKMPINAWYWFTTPGTYTFKYIVECPKGNVADSWESKLAVSP